MTGRCHCKPGYEHSPKGNDCKCKIYFILEFHFFLKKKKKKKKKVVHVQHLASIVIVKQDNANVLMVLLGLNVINVFQENMDPDVRV